jgi:hypothetical protein
MSKKNVILALVLFLAAWSTTAQDKWSGLTNWIGRYPMGEKESFFKLPVIQSRLKDLLGKDDFKHLTEELTLETPIENVKNYLLIEVSKEHCSPCDNAMLVINLENSEMWVGFYKYSKNKSVIRWFSSNDDDYYELPKEILDEFLYMHEPKQ